MHLISHFYNESYLLPFWLKHHQKIFNEATLLDHNSSDDSVEVIKQITPQWKVQSYDRKDFDSEDLNKLVHFHEKKVKRGYKTALNTTEFLIIKNPEKFNNFLTGWRRNCYRLASKLMIDEDLTVSKIDNLLEQKKFGIWNDQIFEKIDMPNIKDEAVLKFIKSTPQRFRFIHNYKYGKYNPGRHSTQLKFKEIDRDIAYIQYYLLSPFNDAFIDRKTQISNKVSTEDKNLDRGYQHLYNKKNLENVYSQIVNNIK